MEKLLLKKGKLSPFYVAAGVGVSLVLALSGLILLKSQPPVTASPSALVTPFTLETKTVGYQNNPKGELAKRTITARRSDGTEVQVATLFPGCREERTMRVLTNPDGRKVQLNDDLRLKTSWPASPSKRISPRVDRMLHPTQNCVYAKYEEFLRNDTVLDHKVAEVSESFQHTSWRAPDLGCQSLRSRVGYPLRDGFKLINETKAISLKVGDPDPRLFDEGRNYEEVKPSEMLKRVAAKVGTPWDAQLQEQAERTDKLYPERQ